MKSIEGLGGQFEKALWQWAHWAWLMVGMTALAPNRPQRSAGNYSGLRNARR
ncbi:hypothetical protein ACVXHB_05475 [Escherichia coli]